MLIIFIVLKILYLKVRERTSIVIYYFFSLFYIFSKCFFNIFLKAFLEILSAISSKLGYTVLLVYSVLVLSISIISEKYSHFESALKRWLFKNEKLKLVYGVWNSDKIFKTL